MKKHGKADEDIRYQGTVLGKDQEPHAVPITGGPVSSLPEWIDQFTSKPVSSPVDVEEEGMTPASSTLSSAPQSPHDVDYEETTQTPMSHDTPLTAG